MHFIFSNNTFSYVKLIDKHDFKFFKKKSPKGKIWIIHNI
jgi:hypothetical protein